MKIKSKVISYIHFDVQLDDKNVISYNDMYKLFLDDYYDYFPDIFKYPIMGSHSIANIDTKYGNARYVDESNWKAYLPLFEYLENLGLIEIDRKYHSGAYCYDIIDMEGLERSYNDILSWVGEIDENMAAITRDVKLEHLLEG